MIYKENKKLYDLQNEAQELINITKENIHNTLVRGLKIDNLEQKSDTLLKSSIEFKTKSGEITSPWYKKYKYYLGGGITTIAIIKITTLLLL